MVVVGGGPAGAVAAWSLARRGIRTLVLDRARFPREKVCGDFVEPRGLRIFQEMGCLGQLEANGPLAITHVNLFLNGRSAYREQIPFYADQRDLPAHGYIIPREELDVRILDAAVAAGAELRQGSQVTAVERTGEQVTIRYRAESGEREVRASLVIGADGTHSVVARAFGLGVDDARHLAVSQRAYVDGVVSTHGEAAFVFDRDLFPGYGWMFPMSRGRANVGVGILAETRDRYRISVPALFSSFLGKLQRLHPGCGGMRLASRPIGGIVKTYGGRGPNYFNGGILVGDAGCYVDPMTGEGITPAAESALLGADTIAAALAQGRSDAAFLASYGRNSHRYFDPAMRYLDFVACLMRNRHFADYWLAVVARGCELAMSDRNFARVGGAAFGGMDVRPLNTVTRIWAHGAAALLAESGRTARTLASGRPTLPPALADLGRWYSGWWGSIAEDPAWHGRWLAETTGKWLRLAGSAGLSDPRRRGPAQLRIGAASRSG